MAQTFESEWPSSAEEPQNIYLVYNRSMYMLCIKLICELAQSLESLYFELNLFHIKSPANQMEVAKFSLVFMQSYSWQKVIFKSCYCIVIN